MLFNESIKLQNDFEKIFLFAMLTFTGDIKITRECESNLMLNTRHRLRMPVLRRQGYCLPARKNDPYNPQETYDPSIQYCFCNDFNGCNTGSQIKVKFLPVIIFFSFLTYFISQMY